MELIMENFADALNELIRNDGVQRHGTFQYTEGEFNQVVQGHFKKIPKPRTGVYIVRLLSGAKEVLYVGKAGSIGTDGTMRNQDIPGRLINERAKDPEGRPIYFQEWLSCVLTPEELPMNIEIEYILLPTARFCPGYAEAFLLQAYLREHGNLPRKNSFF
jgi:hypothetical protein